MGTRLALRLGLHLGLISVSGHDPGAVSSAGRQDPVIPYQVEPWRRYEGGQFLEGAEEEDPGLSGGRLVESGWSRVIPELSFKPSHSEQPIP
jgi:hypothetical protein